MKREELVEEIRSLRDKKGMSQRELASQMNIDPSALNRIEKGTKNFSIDTFLNLTQALDLDLKFLFAQSDQEFIELWLTYSKLSSKRQQLLRDLASELHLADQANRSPKEK